MTDELTVALRIRAAVAQAVDGLRSVGDGLKSLKASGTAAGEGATSASAGLDAVSASADAAAGSVQRAADAISSSTAGAAAAAAASMGGIAASARTAGANVLQQGADFAALDAIMDRTAETADEIAAQELALDRLMQSGAISAEEQAAALAALNAQEEKLGLAMEVGAAATTKQAAGAKGLKAASGGATREYTALIDELASGRIRRVPGTLAVLSNRVGLMQMMFSGVGLAVTGAVGTLALFGMAAISGARQQAEFNDAIEASGGYLGATTGQVRGMAEDMAGADITIGQAKDALLEVGRTGQFTGTQLEEVGRGAAAMANITDLSMKQTVAAFSELAADPLKNVQKLNEHYHFLTASIYDQIAALQQEGDVAGAAAVAIKALSDAMMQRNEAVQAQGGLGAIWQDTKAGFSQMWDAIENNSTPEGDLSRLQSQLAYAQRALKDAQENGGATRMFGGAGAETVGQVKQRVDELQTAIGRLQKTVSDSHAAAASKAALDQENESYVEAAANVNSLNHALDKNYAMNQELRNLHADKTRIETLANDKGASPADRGAAKALLDNTDWSKLESEIRQHYNTFTHSILNQDKETLDKLEAQEGVSYKDRLGFELDFWKGKLAASKAGSEEYAQIFLTVQTLQRQLDTQKTESAKKSEQEYESILHEEVQAEEDAERTKLSFAQEILNQKLALGDINRQQEIAAERELANEEYSAQLDSLQKQLAGQQQGSAAAGRTYAEIEKLAEQHNLKLQQLDDQTTLAIRDHWLSVLGPIQTAFSTSIQGMVLGTESWRKAEANILRSVVAEFIDAGVKMAIVWTATELAKTSTTAAGAATRTTIGASAAAADKSMTASSAASSIMAKAWEAAASVYASIAAIPYIGPFLAPVMALAAAVEVGSYVSRIASASGGWWQIPNDQIAQVHKDEMVLPASIAQPARQFFEGGSGGAGGGEVHLHVHTLDSQSFGDYMRQNPAALTDALQTAHREHRLR